MVERLNTAHNLEDYPLDNKGKRYAQRESGNESPFLSKEEEESLHSKAAGNDHKLDSEESLKTLRKLEDWWYQARLVHSENRYQMALDDDFYDGLQWSEDDRNDLEDRGQPALTFNQIKPSIDWVIGTERRSRVDFRVHPRTADDREAAQKKTHLLKYTDDVNKAGFARSRAFSDSVRVGLGWLEDGIRHDPTDELLYSRNASWRNMWYDHLAEEQDLDDGRYMFRSKWVDLDYALTMFPERADKVKQSARQHDYLGNTDDDEFFVGQLYYRQDEQGYAHRGRSNYMDDAGFPIESRRERIRLVEAWYRVPTKVSRLYVEDPKHARFSGQVYDKENDMHKYLDEHNICSLYDSIQKKMWVAIFCDGALLSNKPSPYIHNRFPFTPVWAYRRKRDGMAYGLVRNQRDPQEDLNKRRSKALFVLSTNQVIADDDAVEDWDELREEAAAPDGIIKKRKGRDLEINRDNALAAQHVDLEQYDKEYIREVSGVTSENLGQETNANSGKAIQARQNQGSTVTYELFDNLRYALQLSGEKRLSLIEQYYDFPKVIRITGEAGKSDFMEINMPKKDETGELLEVEDDITRTQADFVIDQQDYRETVRMAMFETLRDLVGKLDPEIAIQLLDLVVDMGDPPKKEQLIARIREINGYTDPDADDTPEEREAQEAREAEKQEQQALEKKAAILELADKEADVDKKRAEVRKIRAEAEKTIAEIGMEGEGGEQAQAFQDKLREIQQQADDEIAKMQRELDEVLTDQAAKAHEIEANTDTELEKAKIDARARIRIAEIEAASEKKINDLREEIQDVQKKVNEHHGEAGKKSVSSTDKS